MLIMVAALAKTQQSAELAVKYWPVVSRWAEYVKEKGSIPTNNSAPTTLRAPRLTMPISL